MNLRPVFFFSGLSVVAACHGPSQRPATTPSPSSVVVAPVVSGGGTRASMSEQVPGVEWTTRLERLGLPECDEPFPVPVVTRPQPLAASVAAWVEQELADVRSWLSETPCQLVKMEVPVEVYRVHGFVTVRFWAPERMDAKFLFPSQQAFALRTGKPFSHIVAEAKRDLLYDYLRPRYRAGMDQWLQYPDVDPDCAVVLDQYAPSLDDFNVTERGFSFGDWSSIPMWAKACYPLNQLDFSFEELEQFLDPEVRATWRED